MTVPLKNKNAQTGKDCLKKIDICSEKKPKLVETDRSKKFFNIIFRKFLNNNNIKHYSRNSSWGAVFAERFNPTNKNQLKKPVFEREDCIWISFLSTILNQYNNRTHFSFKLTPILASLKKNEGYLYQNLLGKQKKLKHKYEKSNLIKTAD